MPELIATGHVYRAVPPLYGIKTSKGITYLKDDLELCKYQEKSKGKKYIVSRFKGLGEMSAEQLWETTLNPENRTLKQISISEVEGENQELEELVTTLMGTDVSKRRNYIMKNSTLAHVDI